MTTHAYAEDQLIEQPAKRLMADLKWSLENGARSLMVKNEENHTFGENEKCLKKASYRLKRLTLSKSVPTLSKANMTEH